VKALWTSNTDGAGTLMKHPAHSSILSYTDSVYDNVCPCYVGSYAKIEGEEADEASLIISLIHL